jgi:zinc protease
MPSGKMSKTRVTLIWALVVTIGSAGLCRAETGKALTIPEFDRQTLLNGMEMVMLPANQEKVPFMLMISNGAAFDPVEKWGVTYLATRLLLEDSKDGSGQLLLPSLQALGSELTFRVDWDSIWFEGSAPANQLVETLNLLAEMIVQPQFEEESFARLRDQVVKDLEKKSGEPQFATYERFLAEVFGGNPYGHLVRGTPATLKNLQVGDVRLQYRKLFIPNQARLAFYYPGAREDVFSALTRRWGSWIKGLAVPFSFRKADSPAEPRILILDRTLAESVSRWGTLGVARSDRNFYALTVLEQYLTLSLPGWASQVADAEQVRASVSVESRMMPGFVQLNLQAPTEQLPAYLKKFQDTLAAIEQGEMSGERFEEARRLASAEMRTAVANQERLIRELLETTLYNLGINYILNFESRIDRLTPEVFRAAVKEHFAANKVVVVVAGPAETLEPLLSAFGKVRLLN